MSTELPAGRNKEGANLCDGLARQPVAGMQELPAIADSQSTAPPGLGGLADEADQRSRTGSHSAAPCPRTESEALSDLETEYRVFEKVREMAVEHFDHALRDRMDRVLAEIAAQYEAAHKAAAITGLSKLTLGALGPKLPSEGRSSVSPPCGDSNI